LALSNRHPKETDFTKRQQTFVCKDIPLPVYTSKERVGPNKCEAMDIDMKEEYDHSFKQNILWVLTRELLKKKQWIPSWTGFNILVRSEHDVMKDIVMNIFRR